MGLGRPEVGQDREQEEKAGEDITARGHPDHRLRLERVNGEDERGRHRSRAQHSRSHLDCGQSPKAKCHEVEYGGVDGVKQEVDKVVADRIPHTT